MKKQSTAQAICYLLGSLAISIVAFITLPKILNAISSFVYKNQRNYDVNEDDWGPVIVNKNKGEQ